MAADTIPARPELQPRRGSSFKLDEVTRLLHVLRDDFEEKNLLPPQRNATLEELKVHTRSIEDAEPLFTKEGILVLCKHSFDGSSLTTGREALKCLANVLLLKATTRQHFVDLGYASKAADILRRDNRDDEFLASRLLFLCTYETNYDFTDLFNNHQLADSIERNLQRHAKYFAKLGKNPPGQMNQMALCETLKLFFNISQFYPDQVPALTKSLPHICKIFTTVQVPSPPLQQPITYILNSLMNLDLEDKKSHIFATNPLFPKFDPRCNVNRLYSLLDQSIRKYSEEQLEKLAIPLITLLRQIYSFAPEGIQEHLRSIMLPSDEDRLKPLGRTETFSSYLLRLSTAPAAPQVRESIQHLLFELSGKDADKFVRNVGYGFAAGFLLSNNISMPESAAEAWSMGTTDSSTDVSSLGASSRTSRDSERPSGLQRTTSAVQRSQGEDTPRRKDSGGANSIEGIRINPVTGQRLDMEAKEAAAKDEGPPMSKAEKEREAERLYVLFERLRATGVVDVQNPVTKAYQEGRFQELPDDGDDDD